MAVAAFNTRSATDPLARALAPQFTVLNDDRRGRGDSGDTAPYAVDREIEDIAAVVRAVGGSGGVFGYSSGAALALEAVAGDRRRSPARAVRAAVPDRRQPSRAAGRSGRAVRRAGRGRASGRRRRAVHDRGRDVARSDRRSASARSRSGRRSRASRTPWPTTPRSWATCRCPRGLLATVTAPALVISGENSPPFLRDAARAAAAALPGGRLATLPPARPTTSTRTPPRPSWRQFLAS